MRRSLFVLISALAFAILAQFIPAQTGTGPLGNLIQPQDGISRRESSTFRLGKDGKYDRNAPPLGDNTERSNRDNFRVEPGQTHVLMDQKGPGIVTHMWLTFLGPEIQQWAPQGSANHQEMLLRITFDGAKKPQVEAPVGDFFANAFGKRSEVISLPVIVDDGDAYNSFWQMPFRKSCRIEIINQSAKNINLLYYNIDWIQKTSLPKDTPYFHAQYRQEYPAEHGKDYTILETTGKGHYVGTVLSVRTRSPSWFGEGDEKIYIDGEKNASIWGTGTEDYFLAAWGLQKNSTPYFGTPYFDQWGIVGGHTSAYRWHLNDPIVFQRGIKVTIEHMGWMSPDENPEHISNSWNEREDDFSSVAFWYQQGVSTFTARAPSAKERTLPSLERVTAYAANNPAVKHGEGTAGPQNLDMFDHPQLLYQPKTDKGAFVEIPISVKEKEPLRLLLNCCTSYDFGIYQPYLNGVKIGGPIDLYAAKTAEREIHLLDFWPGAGDYTLRLECVGKNPAAQGFSLGIESVRLRERRPRVKAMGFEKDLDWRTNQRLGG